MYGKELSEMVRSYQRTGEGWEELRNRIALFIYGWGLRKRNLGEDGAADYLLSFLPRIKSLVRNYADENCPFEHYVKVCLEWHMVKFHTDRNREVKKEELYWQIEGKRESLLLAQTEPSYPSIHEERMISLPGPLNDRRFKRHLLEYLLYHVEYVTPDLIDPFARFMGMTRDELHCYLGQAEALLEPKREKREAMREKRRSYFIDHCYQEMKLKLAEDRAVREEIRERMAALKHKMEKLQMRIDRIKMTPSTEEVGRITGKSSSSAGRNITTVKEYLARLVKEDGA
jgi:hypothetical protein